MVRSEWHSGLLVDCLARVSFFSGLDGLISSVDELLVLSHFVDLVAIADGGTGRFQPVWDFWKGREMPAVSPAMPLYRLAVAGWRASSRPL